MKKFHKLIRNLHVVALVFLVFGCTDSDVEPIFNQTVNERTNALKTEYLNILTSPENGWIGSYSPNKDFGFYTMLMDFDQDGTVKINSDYNGGDDDNTITYRIDKTLKIELVLETYAVFHEIFSINNNNNGGEFVFNIVSATNNEIVLESKLDFGDDITIFKLRRARPVELDLSPLYNSVSNISSDITKSVFRYIYFNDEIIGIFSFNPETRFVSISYTSDGFNQTVNAPVIITPTGFSFVNPITIKGITLTSFEYDETENQYENPADALRIIYDNIPGIPLYIYNFDVENEAAVFNTEELLNHSPAFNVFYENFISNLATNPDFPDLEINNIILWDLNTGKVPYIEIRTNYGDIYYDLDFTFDISTGIVIFSLTGETNATPLVTTIFQPLLDVFVGSPGGYYAVNTGNYLDFANLTFGLISVDNPSMQIDYWAF